MLFLPFLHFNKKKIEAFQISKHYQSEGSTVAPPTTTPRPIIHMKLINNIKGKYETIYHKKC
jgi:hypothetical protein